MKEVSEPERLFVLMAPTNAQKGGEGEDLGVVRTVKLWVPTAEIHSTIMVSGPFSFPPIMGSHCGICSSAPQKSQRLIYVQSAKQNTFLTSSSRDSETKHSCRTLLCTPNRHSYPSRTTTSSQHIYLCKYLYVCMYGQNFQQSMNQPVMVANPARGQLSRKIIFSLSPYAPDNSVSRDRFGRSVLRQPVRSPHTE